MCGMGQEMARNSEIRGSGNQRPSLITDFDYAPLSLVQISLIVNNQQQPVILSTQVVSGISTP